MYITGHWGGIFEAPSSYSIASANANQKNIKMLKKFGIWNEHTGNIKSRLPYIKKQQLTTSTNGWGSITGTFSFFLYNHTTWKFITSSG